MGTLRLLEAIRFLGLEKKPVSIRLPPLNCTVWCRKFRERNHAVLPALSICGRQTVRLWITVNYRESYGMYACNGILLTMNPRAAAKPSLPAKSPAQRQHRPGAGVVSVPRQYGLPADWGHAKDYVKMQWMMLQQERRKISLSRPAFSTPYVSSWKGGSTAGHQTAL